MNDVFGSLCPISMHYHRVGQVTCETCDAAVRAHLAWFAGRPAEHRERITSGAWMANDGLHWAALELVAAGATFTVDARMSGRYCEDRGVTFDQVVAAYANAARLGVEIIAVTVERPVSVADLAPFGVTS